MQFAAQMPRPQPAEKSTTLADFIVRQRAQLAGSEPPLYPPLSPAERQSAFEWTCKFGPGNCWAGATGTAAIIIRSLLLELAMKESKEGADV